MRPEPPAPLKQKWLKRCGAGFALAETLVSTAFTGIALAGAFGLANTVRLTGDQAALRQKLDAAADDILEQIRSDRRNTDAYAMSLGTDPGHCGDEAKKIAAAAEPSRLKWCLALNDAYPWRQGLTRSVTITAPGTGRRLITVTLQGGDAGRLTESVAKRVIETPP